MYTFDNHLLRLEPKVYSIRIDIGIVSEKVDVVRAFVILMLVIRELDIRCRQKSDNLSGNFGLFPAHYIISGAFSPSTRLLCNVIICCLYWSHLRKHRRQYITSRAETVASSPQGRLNIPTSLKCDHRPSRWLGPENRNMCKNASPRELLHKAHITEEAPAI